VKPNPSPSHMARNQGNDDVATKSITGLESLVDQIPAIAENDSGVFSGSGAGSHPNTPRSVGPYSPAGAPGGNFHTSPFHTPTGSGSASNHFNVPSTSDLAASGAASVSAASENSTNFTTPTDFSVNSLVHHRSSAAAPSVASEAIPTSTFSASDSWFSSVSSLTSSYANDMAAKYAATNPYAASGFFGSSAAASAASFGAGGFLGQPNSFMGAGGSMGSPMTPSMAAGMASMGAMSYYGQYSNTYGAPSAAAASAAAGFAPSHPYSAYMPNPGYPYSHYGQSPYSQSPYF
jgi:hypothetical protein